MVFNLDEVSASTLTSYPFSCEMLDIPGLSITNNVEFFSNSIGSISIFLMKLAKDSYLPEAILNVEWESVSGMS